MPGLHGSGTSRDRLASGGSHLARRFEKSNVVLVNTLWTSVAIPIHGSKLCDGLASVDVQVARIFVRRQKRKFAIANSRW